MARNLLLQHLDPSLMIGIPTQKLLKQFHIRHHIASWHQDNLSISSELLTELMRYNLVYICLCNVQRSRGQ